MKRNNTPLHGFVIQPASKADIAYIATIMHMRWNVSMKWARKETKRHLAQDAQCAGFTVYHRGNVIGVALFSLTNEDVSTDYGPWLYLLWIEPAYRGNDIGIELTKARMEHARNHGYERVYLDTTDAKPYHATLGWEEVCTIMYEGEEDTIMQYDLSKEFPKR